MKNTVIALLHIQENSKVVEAEILTDYLPSDPFRHEEIKMNCNKVPRVVHCCVSVVVSILEFRSDFQGATIFFYVKADQTDFRL